MLIQTTLIHEEGKCLLAINSRAGVQDCATDYAKDFWAICFPSECLIHPNRILFHKDLMRIKSFERLH